MSRLALPALLLTLAAGARADSFQGITFNPPSLDSHTALTAIVRGTSGSGCVPSHGTSSVSGTAITLTVDPPPPLPCVAVVTNWVVPVFIGTLAPGNYEVVTKFGSTELDRRSLPIADADPPFRMEENVGLTLRNAAVTIRLRDPFSQVSLLTATVRFDGIEAQIIDKAFDHLVVAPPAHAPGPVTVTLTTTNAPTLTAVNAFRYVDANAPPDRAAYEAILIPLVFAGAGAFGSSWTTDLWVHNQNPYDVTQFNGPFIVRFCIVGPCLQPIAANQTLKLGFASSSPFPHGRIMYVPRQAAAGLQFGLRVRDLTRQADSHGVEIPVLRERDLRGASFSLLDVPGDAQYRSRLRVYSLDAPTGAVTVRVVSMAKSPDVEVARLTLFMDAPAAGDIPAYGEIDLDPIISGAAEPGPYRVQIDLPFLTPSPSYWAFVSITNNQTQNVTIVTPQ